MPSAARVDFGFQLQDFDEIIAARDAICPAGAGRPAQRRGAATIRSAVVLLSASFEAFVEDLFDLGVDHLFVGYPAAHRTNLKRETSGKLNNASVFKVNMLFFNLGIPWIMEHPHVHWQKFNNNSVRDTLDEIVRTRNRNAHGRPMTIRKPTARRWRGMLERLADRLDDIVADRIEAETGARPW